MKKDFTVRLKFRKLDKVYKWRFQLRSLLWVEQNVREWLAERHRDAVYTICDCQGYEVRRHEWIAEDVKHYF